MRTLLTSERTRPEDGIVTAGATTNEADTFTSFYSLIKCSEVFLPSFSTWYAVKQAHRFDPT